MKISQSRKIKTPIIIASATLLVIATVGLGLASHYKVGFFTPKLDDSINLSEPTDDEKGAAIDIKQQSLDQDTNKTQTGSDPAPAPQPIEGSDKKSVHAEITAANQDSSTLRVRTLIQSVLNSGTCTITLTSLSHPTYTESAEIQALPSSSTCKGFDIPLSKLGSGSWMITVDFSNDDIIATATKEVSIE